MIRLVTVCLLVAIGACAGPPGRAFDRGHEVHVIVVADPAPRRPLVLDMTCAIGDRVSQQSSPVLGGGSPRAREVAMFRVLAGEHELKFVERTRRQAVRVPLDVKHELWVVLILRPRASRPQVAIFKRPPHDEIGAWASRVALPN